MCKRVRVCGCRTSDGVDTSSVVAEQCYSGDDGDTEQADDYRQNYQRQKTQLTTRRCLGFHH